MNVIGLQARKPAGLSMRGGLLFLEIAQRQERTEFDSTMQYYTYVSATRSHETAYARARNRY